MFVVGLATFALLYSTQALLPALSAGLSLTPAQASLTVSATTAALAACNPPDANRTTKAFGGRLSFLWATLAVFSRWQPTEMTIEIDGERREALLLEALAMNGDYAAGGMWVAPEASPDDDRFDVVLIGAFSKAEFATTFPKIYRGTHVSHAKVEIVRARELRVDAPSPLPIVLDGEQPGTTPVRFELVPSALRVRVPAT